MRRRINIIAAVAENGVIGKGGRLPWSIPEDFNFFLSKVAPHVAIMGRRCFAEAGPYGALSIVLTHSPSWRPPLAKASQYKDLCACCLVVNKRVKILHILFVVFFLIDQREARGAVWWRIP